MTAPDPDDLDIAAAFLRFAESTKAIPWMEDAICSQTDPEAFFPDKGRSNKGGERARAMQVDKPAEVIAGQMDLLEGLGA